MPMDGLCQGLAPRQIEKMSLLRLPSKLLLAVTDFLEVEGDLNARTKINLHFYSLLNRTYIDAIH
jgi:hypothetical protein